MPPIHVSSIVERAKYEMKPDKRLKKRIQYQGEGPFSEAKIWSV